jgi:hypothetical protein
MHGKWEAALPFGVTGGMFVMGWHPMRHSSISPCKVHSPIEFVFLCAYAEAI